MEPTLEALRAERPSPSPRQPRASNASRTSTSTTCSSTTGRAKRAPRPSDHSPRRASRSSGTAAGSTAGGRPRSPSTRPPPAVATTRAPGGAIAGGGVGRQQGAHSRQHAAASSSLDQPADRFRSVLDAKEGAMLRYTLAFVRLLLMAVGFFIIGWTGHLIKGLIADFGHLPGVGTMLIIIMIGCILGEFLQAAWLACALRPKWRPSNGCGLGMSLKPYTWELSTDLLFSGIWGALVGSIFLRGHFNKFYDKNMPYVAAGSCAIGLQLICVALVIRLRVVLTVVAEKQPQREAHASVTVQRSRNRSPAAKYGVRTNPGGADLV